MTTTKTAYANAGSFLRPLVGDLTSTEGRALLAIADRLDYAQLTNTPIAIADIVVAALVDTGLDKRVSVRREVE